MPAVPPVSTPPEVMEAVAAGLTPHVPPSVVSVRVMAASEQTAAGPPMAPGRPCTVTGVVIWQPVAVLVKVTVAVPAVPPVSTPPEVMEAVAAGVTLQLPAAVSVSVMVASEQTAAGPPMVPGSVFTMTGAVT